MEGLPRESRKRVRRTMARADAQAISEVAKEAMRYAEGRLKNATKVEGVALTEGNLPPSKGASESTSLVLSPSESALQVLVQGKVELSSGPLMQTLSEAGLGTEFVKRVREFFQPEVWKELDSQMKARILGICIKLVEVSEGAKLTLRVEGQSGATLEEMNERKESLMRLWMQRMGGHPPPTSNGN